MKVPNGSVQPSASTLHVPRTRSPIPITADVDGKKVWEGDRGNTQNFKDPAGKGMVPYTEAKLRWGDEKLYLLLYAGDLDLEGTIRESDGPVENDDSFRLEFASGAEVRVVSVSVLGTVADAICSGPSTSRSCDPRWQSHAEVAVDRDGTLNHVGDNDEEWVVEMVIPVSALRIVHAVPGAHIPFSISRCEVGHGAHSCGSWGKAAPSGGLGLDR